MKLLNATKLAAATGFRRARIEAMKGEPDSPFFNGGLFSTVEAVNQWVIDHPQWRASQAWNSQSRRVHPLHQQRSAAGKRGAWAKISGQASLCPDSVVDSFPGAPSAVSCASNEAAVPSAPRPRRPAVSKVEAKTKAKAKRPTRGSVLREFAELEKVETEKAI